MTRDPLLRSAIVGDHRIEAHGGLKFIRGNGLPHFSLTMDSWVLHGDRWVEVTFGAAHDELVKIWPELAPLAALHLSDIHGVPMHALENAYFWLAGACDPVFGSSVDGGHLGERYHGGSGTYGKTPGECLKILAGHLRMPKYEAASLVEMVKRRHYANAPKRQGAGKELLAEVIESMKPRWKAEAEDAIKSLDLQVYGDNWVVDNHPAQAA